MPSATIVIPAYNEAGAIGGVIRQLQEVLHRDGIEGEILVVVDGATDDTATEAKSAGARVIEHPRNAGYGRSLKTGILAATHDLIAITDADGTYPAERIPELLKLAERFDMVVGERTGVHYQGTLAKQLGRIVFRWLSEFAAGQRIPDINSGLRVFRRSDIVPYFPVISAGFSFTTTCTLVYLLNGLFVEYRPVEYHQRHGQSKVHHLRDSLRALQIIVEAILRCNPIKMFLLLALPFAILTLPLLWWGIATRSTAGLICSAISLSTAALILGLGFVAVACRPRESKPISTIASQLQTADRRP
ncbi:MAG: glycosyltransferase family 2 protein [Planctomycetaceae bacterium]